MSMERKRKFRTRFDGMDNAAIRAWLAPAEHNLRILRDRVAAARFVLDKRQRIRGARLEEQSDG